MILQVEPKRLTWTTSIQLIRTRMRLFLFLSCEQFSGKKINSQVNKYKKSMSSGINHFAHYYPPNLFCYSNKFPSLFLSHLLFASTFFFLFLFFWQLISHQGGINSANLPKCPFSAVKHTISAPQVQFVPQIYGAVLCFTAINMPADLIRDTCGLLANFQRCLSELSSQ